jgi:succinate dehydrogenase flavin-adding protein (antitoxin of CptAB toxin-antitoxin module)
MRELDVLLLRYLEREFAGAAPALQAAFEELLSAQDPEIVDLLAGRAVTEDPDLNEVIQRLLAQSHH